MIGFAPRMVIDSFDGEYDFLSNFYGQGCSTVEHVYQAAKTLDPVEREEILNAPTPGLAKKLGRKATMRADWEEIKFDVMLDFVRQKFKDPVLAKKLLDTGDAELIEGNWWGDRYWGVCKGQGLNNLGKILMQVREELRNAL